MFVKPLTKNKLKEKQWSETLYWNKTFFTYKIKFLTFDVGFELNSFHGCSEIKTLSLSVDSDQWANFSYVYIM